MLVTVSGHRHEWIIIVTDRAGRVLDTSEAVYRAKDMWEKKRELREKYMGSVKFRVIHQELLTDKSP